MSTGKFRFFLVLSAVASVLGAAFEFVAQTRLPDELNAQLDALYQAHAAWKLVAGGVGVSIALLLGLISFFGLLLFKKWAPSLALNSTLLAGASVTFLPPFVSAGTTEMLSLYSAVLWGAVIAHSFSESYSTEARRRAAA